MRGKLFVLMHGEAKNPTVIGKAKKPTVIGEAINPTVILSGAKDLKQILHCVQDDIGRHSE